MKRLLGLAVLAVVLYMFVPVSYAQPSSFYYLIYNVSTTVNGSDYDAYTAVTIPLKGYLVLEFADSRDGLVDANLILYGKDEAGSKKYVQLNLSDDNAYLSADIWSVGKLINAQLWSTGEEPFYFGTMLTGKATQKDIGWGASHKKWVATSIKGVAIVWDNFLLGPSADQDVSGTSTVSASLDLKTTKLVNANDWTQEMIIETGGTIAGKYQKSLIEKLAGYSAATLP